MDEIFHIPQALRYLSNRFTEWDDKITTLPGLYLLSYVYENIGMWMGFEMGSSVSLRSLNVVLTCALFVLLAKSCNDWIRAFRLTLFPLLYFFAFLYYTDVASCLFVCLSFYLAREQRLTLSGLASALAVLMRQSNIIWAFWIVLSTMVDDFELDQRRSGFYAFVMYCLTNIANIIRKFWSFVVLAVLFVGFVYWNEGLTVGDRANHVASTHISQVFYFFTFVVCMEPGLILYQYLFKFKENVSSQWKKIVLALIVLSPLFAYLSLHYSHVHKFILSDNRHYIFYLWRKLFKIHIIPAIQFAECIKYSPIYVLSLLVVLSTLRRGGKSFLWIASFLLCVVLNLVPLPLIEFRYFIVPFMLFNMNTRQEERGSEIITLAWYFLINGATLYMFLFKPFVGPDGAEARFMW